MFQMKEDGKNHDSSIFDSRKRFIGLSNCIDRYTDVVYSKHSGMYYVYDDTAKAIGMLSPQEKMLTYVINGVQGSFKSAKTLRVDFSQKKLFVNHNDEMIIFGDIQLDGHVVNLTYVQRGLGN